MKRKNVLATLAGVCALGLTGVASAGPFVLIASQPSQNAILGQLLNDRLPVIELPAAGLPFEITITTGVGGANYYHGLVVTHNIAPLAGLCVGVDCP